MNSSRSRLLYRFVSTAIAILSFTACVAKPPAPSHTFSMGSHGFPVSGITQEQFESVFKPGWYQIASSDAEYTTIFANCIIKISNNFTWFSEPGPYGYILPPKDIAQDYWGPYMFYRYPSQMGWGGALWRSGPLYEPNALGDHSLTRPSTGSDWLVVILFDAEGNGVMSTIGGQNCHILHQLSNSDIYPDTVSGMIQLETYAWQGLATKYPDHLQPVPLVNPSPYVPPADGSWPTITPPLPTPIDTMTPG